MRILKLIIKNYRSCTETVFKPNEHLSVLIGPNGSGKTNILSAIRLLQRLCFAQNKRLESEESSQPETELTVHYEIDDITVIYNATINIVTSERNRDEIIRANEIWSVPSSQGKRKKFGVASSFLRDLARPVPAEKASANHKIFSLWLLEHKIPAETTDYLIRIVEFVSNITYYSASQFTDPGRAPISFEVEAEEASRVGISITGHKQLLYKIYQEYLKKSDTYFEFINLVGPDGVGLIGSLDFDEIKTSSSNYIVRSGGKVVKKERTNLLVVPRITIAGNTLSPNQLSEGAFKTFALIFCLITDSSSMLMIEEPEVCVHHGLLNSIIELIKTYSNDKQILVSTHSDALLDKVDIDNVFRVQRLPDKGTVISGIKKGMSSKEIIALKKYLNDEGSLGEYWRHGDLEQT